MAEEAHVYDLKVKTALVTGAGKETGIGYAIGRKLAASGMNIILADLGREGADNGPVKTGTREELEGLVQKVVTDYGVAALGVEVDVTSNESIQRMVEKVKEQFSRLTCWPTTPGPPSASPICFIPITKPIG